MGGNAVGGSRLAEYRSRGEGLAKVKEKCSFKRTIEKCLYGRKVSTCYIFGCVGRVSIGNNKKNREYDIFSIEAFQDDL